MQTTLQIQPLPMTLHTWLLFFPTCVGMSLSPGPNGLLALADGALYGSRRTLWTTSAA